MSVIIFRTGENCLQRNILVEKQSTECGLKYLKIMQDVVKAWVKSFFW